MKILITGGAGYIGTELTYKLAENKKVEEVIVYDNLSRPNYNLFIGKQKPAGTKIRFIHGEILDSRKLSKVMQGIDVVYHLAAKATTPFADQSSHLFEQVNHWGTAEVVYAAEAANVSAFVYLSSVSVYGSGENQAAIDSPLNPRTFYGTSKMRGEEHVKRLAEKLPAWIIRCGNVYGYSKSMRFDAVINKFMFDANFNNRISVHGNGQQERAFVSIQNCVSALEKLLFSDCKAGIYNLVDRNLSIIDISEALQTVFPGLEMLFINQHLKLRTITVQTDNRLTPLMQPAKSLEDELREFQREFTF